MLFCTQMGDGHGMGNSSNIHSHNTTPGGGGHGQMNPMVAEGQQNHSQRQMCVRIGCSNPSSNPTEYAIF